MTQISVIDGQLHIPAFTGAQIEAELEPEKYEPIMERLWPRTTSVPGEVFALINTIVRTDSSDFISLFHVAAIATIKRITQVYDLVEKKES